MRIVSHCFAGFCGLGVCVSAAQAALWIPSSGTSGLISYSNGQDSNGHFSNPLTGEEKFVFVNPITFLAVSPGSPTTVTDTLSFDATVPGGYQITQVSAQVSGDYSLAGPLATVSYTATLTLDGGAYSAPVVFAPVAPITSGDGEFSGTVSILLPSGISSVSVAMTGTLQATSATGSTSLVQIKNAQISFTVIPEPVSLSLISGAGVLFLRRRRS